MQEQNIGETEKRDENGIAKPAEGCCLNEDKVWELGIDIGKGKKIYLTYVPPGEFMMGQSEYEKTDLIETFDQAFYDEWFTNETPRHKVEITKGFWMGKVSCNAGTVEGVHVEKPLPFQAVFWNDKKKCACRNSFMG